MHQTSKVCMYHCEEEMKIHNVQNPKSKPPKIQHLTIKEARHLKESRLWNSEELCEEAAEPGHVKQECVLPLTYL